MQFPLINGDYFSYADITFRFNGLQFAGIKTISYRDTLGRQFVRGTARKPLGKTAGHYEASGEVEFYKPAFDIMITAISLLGLPLGGWRRIPFVVSVSYGAGIGIPVTTDTLTGVNITEVDASQSEGEDALTRKLTLMPQEILWNGLPSIVEPAVLAAIG